MKQSRVLPDEHPSPVRPVPWASTAGAARVLSGGGGGERREGWDWDSPLPGTCISGGSARASRERRTPDCGAGIPPPAPVARSPAAPAAPAPRSPGTRDFACEGAGA